MIPIQLYILSFEYFRYRQGRGWGKVVERVDQEAASLRKGIVGDMARLGMQLHLTLSDGHTTGVFFYPDYPDLSAWRVCQYPVQSRHTTFLFPSHSTIRPPSILLSIRSGSRKPVLLACRVELQQNQIKRRSYFVMDIYC